MKSMERTFVCVATTFTKIMYMYKKQQWEKCLFVPGSRVTLMTGMQGLLKKNGIVIGHLPRKVARVWIQKTVDRFQIVQQSHIHVLWIRVNKI